MAKIHLKQIIILCFLNIAIPVPIPEPGDDTYCPAENSTIYPVQWPRTSTKTPSQPPCVDDHKEILYRECLNGSWGKEPQCDQIQPDEVPLCPDGFTYIESMCFMVTTRTSFPPVCPFPDVLPFYKYIDRISANVTDTLWVPAVRNLSDGVDFLRWVEPSDFYKQEVTEYFYTGNINGKNCLIYDTNLGIMMAVSCNEEHVAICAYKQLSDVDNKACNFLGVCYQSDYQSKTTCFCVEERTKMESRAEFINLYQNGMFLIDNLYNFGLQKAENGTYYWTNSNQEIKYTFWSPDAVFDDDYVYGAMTAKGWVLTKNLGAQSIVVKEVPQPDVTLTLNFDNNTNVFVVTVTNPYWLQPLLSIDSVHCFTDAFRSELLTFCHFDQILDDDSVDIFNYTFKPVEPFGGYYWCEAFKFTNLELVSTEKILFQTPEYLEFVTILQVTIESLPYDLLNPSIMTVLNNTVLSKLRVPALDGSYYVPRIMKICAVDEDFNVTYLNVHFSSTLEITPSTNSSQLENEYTNFQFGISTLVFNTQNIEIISLLSANFCNRQTIYYFNFYLTWPTTVAGNEAPTEDFCFRPDGNIVTNKCSGNFTEGFQWATPYFDCQFLPKSSLSPYLVALFHQTQITTDDMVALIKLNATNFISSDIYLYAEITLKYSTSTNLDLDVFVKAVENVFKMNRRSLLAAQIVTRATDKLLYAIDIVLQTWPEPIKIINDHFVLLTTPPGNVGGVYVHIVEESRKLDLLQANWSPEKVTEIDNLEFAILFSPEMNNKIQGLSKLAFSLFFNDALFGEEEFSTKNVSIVSEVLFLTESDADPVTFLPEPVTIIQKVELDDNMYVSCVGWKSENFAKGTWLEIGESYNVSSFQICNFWYDMHYALATIYDKQNVTADLENLLNGDYFESELVGRLLTITQRYDYFDYIDVLLVGKVLDLAKNNSKNDLDKVAMIVDNLHKIDKPVLSQSQEAHRGTDLILHSVDNIVDNYNMSETEVLQVTDNFVLFVAKLNASDATGLLFFEKNRTWQALVVRRNFTVENITSYHNLSSAILFSSNVKTQWKNDSKIIITMFFSDVLFNEDEPKHKNVSKIFGVVLPEGENFTYPITIFHNVTSTKNSMECAHWNYSTTSQNRSYWKKDSQANSGSTISQCEFWHTTHFALILTNSAQDMNYDVLDWIATINSSLSLLGLLGIILTAILFKKWRRNIGNRILLNFSCAIIIQIVTFYIASTVNRHSDSTYCTLVGVLLHYSIVSQFCWMLTIAVLQFKRFVQVFVSSPKYLLLKTCVCGWVFPILPVMLALVLDNEKYVMGDLGLCYPTGLGLYLGVWVPVGIIGTINFIIFLYIIYSVFKNNVEYRSGKNDGKHQWRLFILLFFMLGLVWMFGFLTGFSFGFAFACLFCFTATLQGFVLFLYFIVFNVNTRYLYAQAFQNLLSKRLK